MQSARSSERSDAGKPAPRCVAAFALRRSLLSQQWSPCIPTKALRQMRDTSRGLDHPKDMMVIKVLRIAG